MPSKIQNRFLQLKFRVHAPTFKTIDRKVTRRANEAHGAGDAGDYVKILIDRDIKKKLDSAQVKARKMAYENTYSYDNNFRLGLIENIDEIMREARKAKEWLEKQWRDLILSEDKYSEILNKHASTLGTMYNPNEMDSLDTIKNRFWVELDVRPMEDVSRFVALGVANDEIDRITAETEERTRRSFSSAVDSLKADMIELLKNLVDKTEKIDNRVHTKFHPSVIENIESMALKIEAVDGFSDNALMSAVKSIKEDIVPNNTVQIKHSEVTRSMVKKASKDAIKVLSGVKVDEKAKDMIDNLSGMTF